jgi:creatinine amidohydrolase
MVLKSHWWWDLTTQDFSNLDAERVVAILPVGAVEQHGPHLPVRVDAAINAGIIERAVELMPADCPALVLPMMPVGKSDEHLAFPGTLTLSYETLGRVWFELGESVHRAGIRKLLFFNSHGGQPQLLDIVCRDLRVKLGMFAVSVMWPRLIDMNELFEADENRHGIHGGQSETSVMLHLHPDLVEMDHAENFVPLSVQVERESEMLGPDGAARFGWQTQDLHPKGACGDATKATAELGGITVERAAARLLVLIDQISRYPLSRIVAHTAFDKP